MVPAQDRVPPGNSKQHLEALRTAASGISLIFLSVRVTLIASEKGKCSMFTAFSGNKLMMNGLIQT